MGTREDSATLAPGTRGNREHSVMSAPRPLGGSRLRTQSFQLLVPLGARDYVLSHASSSSPWGLATMYSLISALGTPRAHEDSAISASRAFRTRVDSVFSAPDTLGNRADSVISAPRTLGTEYFKTTGTLEPMTASRWLAMALRRLFKLCTWWIRTWALPRIYVPLILGSIL